MRAASSDHCSLLLSTTELPNHDVKQSEEGVWLLLLGQVSAVRGSFTALPPGPGEARLVQYSDWCYSSNSLYSVKN